MSGIVAMCDGLDLPKWQQTRMDSGTITDLPVAGGCDWTTVITWCAVLRHGIDGAAVSPHVM